uniref:L1 transposable element RRM domain-containing protein n=1 Tax=Equus caballus TaxID=9796 RepID=A0A9L0RZ95_HORSE
NFNRDRKYKNVPNGKHRAGGYSNYAKNTIVGFNNRLNKAEKIISELEDKAVKFIQSERQKEKRIKKSKDCLHDLRENIKQTDIHIIQVLEGEGQKGAENFFGEIMAKNLPELGKETDIQIQEAQRLPNKMTPKRPTPKYIRIKLSEVKDKERILKAAREKAVTYKGTPIKLQRIDQPESKSTRKQWP